ncbi:fibronectin type III domain-containing protein [Candidatus Microgenomates bacterium]|nr:fibronectin type III domain-containing protein [Candidatus Microgenomates bacterium]
MKKILRKLSEIIFVVFMLAVFLYSGHRVLSYLKVIKTKSLEAFSEDVSQDENWNCGCCGSNTRPCELGESLCERLEEWCGKFCHRPTPTPTSTTVFTPTPTFPSEEPTSTPTPSPTATLGSGPTATPGPAADGPVGGGCDAGVPIAPKLISAIKVGSEASLLWNPVLPVTHYAIAYGTVSGSYQYGVSNTGNVTAYKVGELNSASDYCFVVAAVNDCASSPYSNEVCTGVAIGEGKVLGLAVTSGEEWIELAFSLIGLACILNGLRLVRPLRRR